MYLAGTAHQNGALPNHNIFTRFILAHAVNTEASKESASFLLSVLGISSTIGRLINGWVADQPKVTGLFTFFSNGLLH